MSDKLPDLLRPGLTVVFCGTAAGHRSAEQRSYYAGPGNKFWPTLAEVGLTDRRLRPDEFPELLSFNIGLTDLAKKVSGLDTDLSHGDFDVAGFQDRLTQSAPRFIAFNGKRAAAVYFGRQTSEITLGKIDVRLGASEIWVLPSTSGAASGHWEVEPWRALAAAVKNTNH